MRPVCGNLRDHDVNGQGISRESTIIIQRENERRKDIKCDKNADLSFVRFVK